MSISGCMGGPACSGLGAYMGTLEGVLQTSRGVMGAWQASGSSPGAPGACVALLGTPPGAPGASRTSSEGLREACASSPACLRDLPPASGSHPGILLGGVVFAKPPQECLGRVWGPFWARLRRVLGPFWPVRGALCGFLGAFLGVSGRSGRASQRLRTASFGSFCSPFEAKW